jgi:hypothetical protein
VKIAIVCIHIAMARLLLIIETISPKMTNPCERNGVSWGWTPLWRGER